MTFSSPGPLARLRLGRDDACVVRDDTNGIPRPAPAARPVPNATDGLGRLLDYGHTRYRPPAKLREFVIARDRECQFPGCHRRGRSCEIDHLTARADGGNTNQHNLICLCPRHHHLKHDTTWTIHPEEGGTLRWTSPNGRVHHNESSTYPIDHAAETIASPNAA